MLQGADPLAQFLPLHLDHPPLALAFKPPPKPHIKTDDNFWEARKVPIENQWRAVNPDLALKIRRPRKHEKNGGSRQHPIRAYSSIREASKEEVLYYLKLDALLNIANRQIEGARLALEEDVLPGRPWEQFLHNLKRELHAGIGFPSLKNGLQKIVHDGPAEELPPPMLPQVDILGALSANMKMALINKLDFRTRQNFKNYLSDIRLGIVVIVGSRRRTDHLAVTALMYINNHEIGKLYCCAPTHHAISKFAKVLHEFAEDTARVTKGYRAPLVVCGRDIETEVDTFMKVAGHRPFDPCRDIERLSAC